MLGKNSFIPFRNSWDRIARAKSHGHAFDELWRSVRETGLLETGLEIDSDGMGTLRCVPGKSTIPSDVSLLLGEMLYQLRAALDNAIYDAIIIKSNRYPPPNGEALEFPICSNVKQYKREAFKIAPLSDKQRMLIESLQPYNAPPMSPDNSIMSAQRTLSILNTWTRIERHRAIKIVSSWVTNADPNLILPPGAHLKGMNVRKRGLLDSDNVVARFRLKGFTDNMDIRVDPDLHLNPVVDECPIACHPTDDLSTRMNMMLLVVKDVVRAIEAD
jgi:hypothetical protein